MSSSLVSVIIPVYNAERYLKECISSVINQTYKNLEVICIDDGSFDNSCAILDEFAKKDGRITVIHQKNGRRFFRKKPRFKRCSVANT